MTSTVQYKHRIKFKCIYCQEWFTIHEFAEHLWHKCSKKGKNEN